jgi:hypothetical protein
VRRYVDIRVRRTAASTRVSAEASQSAGCDQGSPGCDQEYAEADYRAGPAPGDDLLLNVRFGVGC